MIKPSGQNGFSAANFKKHGVQSYLFSFQKMLLKEVNSTIIIVAHKGY